MVTRLTGNAVFSRCTLHNFFIRRDFLHTDYFSSEKVSRNAFGKEKRMGGRMVLVGETETMLRTSAGDGATPETVVVASAHKFNEVLQNTDPMFAGKRLPLPQPILAGKRGGGLPTALVSGGVLSSPGSTAPSRRVLAML